MRTAEIRDKFLQFFVDKGHTVVASSALIPANDPTLMFTNSGMVQFKDVFLGYDKRPYVRAVSCQACLRAGGKHNDLENVGYTARHHTFFEMLGNWSFGDYFKHDSIVWGWELLTKVYGLDANRLMATVYFEDDEAYDIWTKVIGLPPERVVRIGDNKGKRYASDNFWMMADTGPCGPCSEIFYDHGAHIAGGPPGSKDEDGDRFIEIWNHVFMQFDMKADGSITKLPAPCVDTGMGLERLAAILQGKHNNYEIDLFARLIKSASEITHTTDINNPSLKVIADHIRACAFLMVDGVIPGNEGRGYVLRRIARRAIRHGYKLGVRAPFLYKLLPALVVEMGASYPALAKSEKKVGELICQEEERFFQTIEHGMAILEFEINKKPRELNGETAFKLHDTFGFPLDLTQDICREHNITVDINAFNNSMEKQKDQARSSGKFKSSINIEYSGATTNFIGYEKINSSAKILALYKNSQAVDTLHENDEGIVILDTTPFYAESGGQVGDQGLIINGACQFQVTDTQKIQGSVFVHYGKIINGKLTVSDNVQAQVDESRRVATMRNHSATHILHKALRTVLGTHIEQKGSQVDCEKTRFDFAHNAPLTCEEIFAVEEIVNNEILANIKTSAEVMDIESAKKSGAVMLFGEKYGEKVRVLTIGTSKEFCGGTHIERSGDIGTFKIISESGVAAGIRRIEAITGLNSINYLNLRSAELSQIAELTKTPLIFGKVLATVKNLQNDKLEFAKEISALKAKLAQLQGGDLLSKVVHINDTKLLIVTLESADNKILRETLDNLKAKIVSGVIVLASVIDGKVSIIAGVTADLTAKYKAVEIVNFVASQVGGKGGGRADMAMAGGTLPENLAKALSSVEQLIGKQ